MRCCNRYLVLALVTCSLVLSACKQEQTVQKVTPPEPEKKIFNVETAQAAANDLFHLEQATLTENTKTSPASYQRLTLVSSTSDPDKIPPLLSELAGEDTNTILLRITIKTPDPKITFASLPFVIFQKKQEKWEIASLLSGPLTPWYADLNAPLEISTEMLFLKGMVNALESDSMKIHAAFSAEHELYRPAHQDTFLAVSTALDNRLNTITQGIVKPAVVNTIHLSQEQNGTLILKNESHEEVLRFAFSIETKDTFLSLVNQQSYTDLLSTPIATQTPRNALLNLELSLWDHTQDKNQQTASCVAFKGALLSELGLASADADLFIKHFIDLQDRFGAPLGEKHPCQEDEIATSAEQKAIRPLSTEKMNNILNTVAHALKNNGVTDYEVIKNVLAPSTLVLDDARLLFNPDQNTLIETVNRTIAPGLPLENTTDFLLSLPIDSFGCYSKGPRQKGNHRISLLSLEHDPNLWLIDFSFNPEEKVDGILLRKAEQIDYCRSIGKRDSGNSCLFSQHKFKNVSQDRCG